MFQGAESIRSACTQPIVRSRGTVQAMGVGLAVIATALGAFVRIPVPGTPVPVTLQTFFVLLAGAALGRRAGSLSQVLYLALGAAGLPVFAGAQGGLSYITQGATTGYLVGFVAAAWVVGTIICSGHAASRARVLIAAGAGTAVVYVCGVLWFAGITRCGLTAAIRMGVTPFLVGDALKLVAIAALAPRLRHRFEQIL